MKILNINSYKIKIHFLFLLLLIVNACSQSEMRSGSNVANAAADNLEAKPDINIHTAVISGDLDAVTQHIKAGTDINQKDAISDATPLMTAVTFNKSEIVKALIDAKADLAIQNRDGSTALHTAAFFGRIEIVQLLIDANADKTIKNNFGASPRETVMVDFAELKPFYDMLVKQLSPMGFELDMAELQEARPIVALMLQ
jgi:ankyrin repeat protein